MSVSHNGPSGRDLKVTVSHKAWKVDVGLAYLRIECFVSLLKYKRQMTGTCASDVYTSIN